jgi:hypothetical protein
MLLSRQTTEKLIELQLKDLSDDNLERLYKEMNRFLEGQKAKERALLMRERLELGITVAAKEKQVHKTKRPRITTLRVDITHIEHREQQEMKEHWDNIRKMFTEDH